MQKLQDSVFSIVKTTSLSPAVFNYLQPSEDFPDKTPLGGILNDTKHGWLALGPKFCVVDLRTGLKVAQRTFGTALSNFRTTITSVVELPTPLTDNSQQLVISLECEDIAGMICVFHINGSQILRCIKTEVVVSQLAICDGLPDGPLSCFDGAIMAGTKNGEIFVFDLNRSCLIQALKDISEGYEQMVRGEESAARLTFLPVTAISQVYTQRDLAVENDDHLAMLLNENSLVEDQYIFRNPDGTVRMKAKTEHIRVTVVQYIPQLASLAVGFNFGAFQIWNLLTLDLEYTSKVNVECLPVTHFGFQEPCDDPRAFCYLWAVFSVIDRFDEEEFPFAVMYSLTYQGKRMLSDTKCLYQEFLTATVRFQIELSTTEEDAQLVGGRCVSCHTYSVNSMLGGEGEDSMLNICQLVWECWGENANSAAQYGMLLFDLDQWYKDQMPATHQLQSAAFMSAAACGELARGATATLDVRLAPASVAVYCAATRLEEHFYPNSLRYDCICLNTSESCVLSTTGIQRQIINSLDEVGPTALLNPTRLYHACAQTGLVPLYQDTLREPDQEEQRRYLLSVALEARLSRFLKRCAHDWATGSHAGARCTLPFLVDWCWRRALELKESAGELTAPLFTSAALPDRNVVRCLEHCVQQLSQLTGLLDAVLTKCCNLVVPEALSEMEEKYKGIGTVSLYFQVVQWFLRCGLLPERSDNCNGLPYPGEHLTATYNKRRLKLNLLQERSMGDDSAAREPCPLLYIDQLIEQEFGGDRIHQMWIRGGSESNGLYPPPSLYSLLRLYLLPDIAEEHKHSLVLYLLVDYSMVYDEVRYEAVIRRLMQFPTMFGLSNTAIKATQAFWHLDHRDFDFALDQLQCLTGNTLSEWQHQVVLSSLLAQKKTQAALQYLHVRKPAPIQTASNDLNSSRVNDHDKLEDWQSCCNLYLARGLVFEALDVIRMCAQSAGSLEDKAMVLNFFFRGCRNTGQLSKLLQVTLLPFEEEVFIRYLQNCDESQTSDILIMYYLQQARYLEAEQYNKQIKHSKNRSKDLTGSLESLADVIDREGARDTLVEVVCSHLPDITNTVAYKALEEWDTHIIAPKPMSVFVQANSPKNTYVYKSTFIQDTIENASETWVNKPKARKGLKRALNIEETPFLCTPKLARSKNIFSLEHTESTPPKRPRLDAGTPRTPRARPPEPLSKEMSLLLDMPEVHAERNYDNSRVTTPHSILKIRSSEACRDMAVSPVDSRYLGDSDDESLLETASNHTHYSDSTNKHLRFTIPTASESGSTPSPPVAAVAPRVTETELYPSAQRDRDVEMSLDSFVTTESHAMTEPNPLESPPKRKATEESVHARKSYKDSVRARRSLSISANSSLSDDPNTSIESIADIPITLINPRYSGEKRRNSAKETESAESANEDKSAEAEKETSKLEVPKTPKGRRGIRASSESTPLLNRSRSRSRTPEPSPRSSPLAPIPELPLQERASAPHAPRSTLSAPRHSRRSRTPERTEKVVESPRLEVISESPTQSSDSPSSSPTQRRLRSRSRTPEVEVPEPTANQATPITRTLRSRSKTPEKLMSPKKDAPKSAKKSLSRIVLEANAIAASKQNLEKQLEPSEPSKTIESTPMKSLKPVSSLVDVTISPIISKSILQSSDESILAQSASQESKSANDTQDIKSIHAFTLNETKFGKSVLHSYESSTAEISHDESKTKYEITTSKVEFKTVPAFTLSESYFEKSVLHSYESSVADASSILEEKLEGKVIALKPSTASTSLNITDFDKSVLASHDTTEDKSSHKNVSSLITSDSETEEWKDKKENQDVIQKEKEKIVEIEREINEIENDISEEEDSENEGMEIDTSADSSAEDEEDEDDEEEESENENESSSSASIILVGDSDDSHESLPERKEKSKSHVIQKRDSNITTEKIESVEKGIDAKKVDTTESIQVTKKNSNAMTHKIDTVESGTAVKTVDSNVATEKIFVESVQISTDADKIESVENSADPLNQAQISLMTDDNSVHSDRSDMELNYSDEKAEDVDKAGEDKVDAAEKIETKLDQIPEKISAKETPVTGKQIVEPMETEEEKSVAVDAEIITEKIHTADKITTSVSSAKEDIETKEDISESKSKEVVSKDSIAKIDTAEEEETPKKPITRSKRARSTNSTSSTKEAEPTEPKTPITRKRTQSATSNKSATKELKTPEDSKPEATTPSRRRAKTPNTEVRKIITRRASKELSEKLDDSLTEEVLTPRRRSTRSRSKNIDDNASIASGSSVRSTRSKQSEDVGEVKPVRKGRKSVLSTKPDLSVIPESTVEESSKAEDIVAEYSSSRRLTRHQKTVLESWLEPTPVSTRRRTSTTSRASAVSEHSHDDDDASSTHSAFDVQPIDRISLLNKGDFEGSPDPSELQGNVSPESIASDAGKMRRPQMVRASSESRTTTPKAKAIRRISVDISETPERGSPAPASPSRGRRASFTKACEALSNTPKGRRSSTDVRKSGDTDSATSSPPPSEADASTTPARRPRRASAQSAASTSKDTATPKRPRKLSAIEESKDTKKK